MKNRSFKNLFFLVAQRCRSSLLALSCLLLLPAWKPAEPITTDNGLAGPAGECSVVMVDRSPAWTVSQIQPPEGSSSLMISADAATGELREFLPDGTSRSRLLPAEILDLKGELDGHLSGPLWIWKKGARHMLEYKDPWMVFVLDDQAGEVLEEVRLQPRTAAGDRELIATFQAAPSDRGFLAFGDVRKQDCETCYESSLVFYTLENDLYVHDAFTLDVNDPERDVYLLNTLSYVAAFGDTGYMLRMSETPQLLRIDLKTQELRPFGKLPSDFSEPLQITRTKGLRGDRQALRFYKQMQRQSFIANIFATEKGLYLLGRRAIDGGPLAEWWTIRLDEQTGEERYRRRLPTSSPHVSVLPTTDDWIILEKGAVQAPTGTAVFLPGKSIVSLPTSWIAQKGDSTLADSSPYFCHRVTSRKPRAVMSPFLQLPDFSENTDCGRPGFNDYSTNTSSYPNCLGHPLDC